MPSLDVKPFVRFGDDVIDHCLDIVLAFVHSELSICAGALAHDPFDMRHFAMRAELVDFTYHELEQFIQ